MLNPIEHWLQIRQLQGGDFSEVQKVAIADKHQVLAPSHVMKKNGEIVGALEIATLPMVMIWGHTQKLNIRDSLDMMRFYENVAFGNLKAPSLVLPCKTDSPYYKYLQRPELQYYESKNFSLFIKKA